MNERLSRICGLCGALPGKPCVSDRGRTREYPHKIRLAENPAAKALDAAWQEYVRKLLLGMPLTNIGPERSMPEGTLVRWMPAEEWDKHMSQFQEGGNKQHDV